MPIKVKERPKKHHFVPRWYLQEFVNASSGFLIVYDKCGGAWRRQKPKEVMVINNYYRQLWAPDGTDPDVVEIILGQMLEPNAKRAIGKLIKEGPLAKEDIVSLVFFIEFQRIRVPREAERAKALTKLLLTKFVYEQPGLRDIAEELRRGRIQIKINDAVRFAYMKTVIGVFAAALPHMIWEVITASKGTSFLTTDSPVSLFNPAFPPPAEAGINQVGTSVLLPLTPNYLLMLGHPGYDSDNSPPPETPVDYPEVEDVRVKFRFWEMPPEGVKRINWVMATLADRYIVANDESVIDNALKHGIIS